LIEIKCKEQITKTEKGNHPGIVVESTLIGLYGNLMSFKDFSLPQLRSFYVNYLCGN